VAQQQLKVVVLNGFGVGGQANQRHFLPVGGAVVEVIRPHVGVFIQVDVGPVGGRDAGVVVVARRAAKGQVVAQLAVDVGLKIVALVVGFGRDAILPAVAGRKQDNAVGRPVAIDGRRGRILEHRNGADVVGRHVVNRARDAVNQHQRRAARVKRADAPHRDVGAVGARPAAALLHLHARRQPRQRLRRLRNGPVIDIGRRNRGHRAGQ
nr:hypothetical protein [Tanacetum cinerariifolium]